MPTLSRSLLAWPGPEFSATLKAEIEALPAGSLPLAEGGALGGYVDDASITVTLLDCRTTAVGLQAGIGVFYGEILAGCSCSEEPETLHSYCELDVHIDPHSAEARFTHR